MTEAMNTFLTEDIGLIIRTNENGEIEEQICADAALRLSEKGKKSWKYNVPAPEFGQRREKWDFLDPEKKRMYMVTTSTFIGENGLYQLHFLSDVSQYTELYKDITKISSEWEEMSRFQTEMLSKLSEGYTSILKDICDIFHAKEVNLFLQSERYGERISYNADNRAISKSRIDLEDPVFAVKQKGFYKGMICFLSEKAGERSYCLLLKDGPKFAMDKLNDILLYNAISLFVQNSLLRDQIVYASEHDGLTGLYNKAKYISMLEDEFGHPESIAIFNMDLNFLKKMNDTYGHVAGDNLLIMAAKSILMTEDENVCGFRMGGDEFIMIARNVDEEGALEIKKRWEANVEELNKDMTDIPLVVACGMTWGNGDYSLPYLLKKADELMYIDKKAKKGGRTD